jgi:hypothetical protein
MVSLISQKDRQAVQKMPFCYLCGKDFANGDTTNTDHVPPKCIFAEHDRDPLVLRTHAVCNKAYELIDEKIGQLIALRYRKVPAPERRRLQFALSPYVGLGAVANLDIDAAVWRWIRGFHAALCRCSAVNMRGAVVTPFPKGKNISGRFAVEPLRPQHLAFVQTIKINRIKGNLDRIRCNKGKLTYECVWCQADNNGPWMCIFALDIYDWKDLGRTSYHPARGCAGFYVLPSGAAPPDSTRGMTTSIIIPTSDPLDPFSRQLSTR